MDNFEFFDDAGIDDVNEEIHNRIDALVYSSEDTDYVLSRLKAAFADLYDSFADRVKTYIELCEPTRHNGEVVSIDDDVELNFLYHNLLLFLLEAPNELADTLYRCPFIANAMPGIANAELLVAYLGANSEKKAKSIQITSTAIFNTFCLIEDKLPAIQEKINKVLKELKDFKDLDAEELKYRYDYLYGLMTSSPVDALVPARVDNQSVQLITALMMDDTITRLTTCMDKYKDTILAGSYIGTTSKENRERIMRYFDEEFEWCTRARYFTALGSLTASFSVEYNRDIRYPVVSPAGYAHIVRISQHGSEFADSDFINLLKNACSTNFTENHLSNAECRDYVNGYNRDSERYMNFFVEDYEGSFETLEDVYFVGDRQELANYKMRSIDISANASNYLYTLGETLSETDHIHPDIFYYLAKNNVQSLCIMDSWQDSTRYNAKDFPSSINTATDNFSIYNGTTYIGYAGYAPYNLDKETYSNPLVYTYMAATYDLVPHDIFIDGKETDSLAFIKSINDRVSVVNGGYGIMFPNSKNYDFEDAASAYDFTDRIPHIRFYDDFLNNVYMSRYLANVEYFDNLTEGFFAIMQLAYDDFYPLGMIGYGKKYFSHDERRVDLLREICNIIVVLLLDTGTKTDGYLTNDMDLKKLDKLIEQFVEEVPETGEE